MSLNPFALRRVRLPVQYCFLEKSVYFVYISVPLCVGECNEIAPVEYGTHHLCIMILIHKGPCDHELQWHNYVESLLVRLAMPALSG